MSAATDGTPLTVIGGYLGAGKTTLLNHLLRHNNGMRLALVVNDFGDINIDAELLGAIDGSVTALANGCICCTLVDGLATVLADLRDRADGMDHVVVEASGVSDPVKIGQYASAFGFALQGVIVVVDAEQVQRLARDKYVGDTVVRHLQGADLLVLNKTDLLDTADLAAVRAWLAGLVPAAPIVEARDGQVPIPVLLGPADRAPAELSDHAAPLMSHAQYDSWSFVCESPLARAGVEAFLAQLPADVLRAKGFLEIADDPGSPYLLQVVGRRSALTPHLASRGTRTGTRLVVIGPPGSLDGGRLESALGPTAR